MTKFKPNKTCAKCQGRGVLTVGVLLDKQLDTPCKACAGRGTIKDQVKRETKAEYRTDVLLFTADAYGVEVRRKGRREAYWVPWSAVYDLGAKLSARDDRTK